MPYQFFSLNLLKTKYRWVKSTSKAELGDFSIVFSQKCQTVAMVQPHPI